jgi:hypothetical protein
MHTLLKISMTDIPRANAVVSDGSIKNIFDNLSKKINPETSFFYSEQGYRTAIFVFDMKDASQIPQICEPLFTELNAKVDFFPAMDHSELTKGLESMKKDEPVQTSLS